MRTHVMLEVEGMIYTGWTSTKNANAAIRTVYRRRLGNRCKMLSNTKHNQIITTHVFGYTGADGKVVCHKVIASLWSEK